MDVTNLLIISLLLLEEEELHNEENQRRRERWAAMSQVEREERNRSIPRISLPDPQQSPWNIAYHSKSERALITLTIVWFNTNDLPCLLLVRETFLTYATFN